MLHPCTAPGGMRLEICHAVLLLYNILPYERFSLVPFLRAETEISETCEKYHILGGSRVVQRSQALYLSTRGVTTDPGSIPGCITTGHY
jgi:hypothetical protein